MWIKMNDKLTSFFPRASSFLLAIYFRKIHSLSSLILYHIHSCALLFDIINVTFNVLTAELIFIKFLLTHNSSQNSPRNENSNNFKLFHFFITLWTAIFYAFLHNINRVFSFSVGNFFSFILIKKNGKKLRQKTFSHS